MIRPFLFRPNAKPVIARSPCDEAIHSFFLPRYGLLRIIGRRFRADPLARNDDESYAAACFFGGKRP